MKLMKIFISSLVLIFFISCGDNTLETVTSDIDTIKIDEVNGTTIYATQYLNLHATAIYQDGSTDDVTNSVSWKLYNKMDYISVSLNNNQILPASNGGSVNISAVYKNLSDLNDTISISIIKLNYFNITSSDITTTGVFNLEAQANFEDGTKNKIVDYNVIWSSSNSDDTIIRENNIVTIEIDEIGERTITATVFDIEQSKVYTIN